MIKFLTNEPQTSARSPQFPQRKHALQETLNNHFIYQVSAWPFPNILNDLMSAKSCQVSTTEA